MNKNAIQKFAIWARNELITQVSQRAYQYGIDESGFCRTRKRRRNCGHFYIILLT